MKKGFTLIELLVVSTIIIVLMSIGIVSYRGVQKKSRDAKRKSDLEQVRAALEMYRSDSDDNSYPGNNWSSMTNALEGGGYLHSSPVDPKGGYYIYRPGSGGYTYILCAYLEAGSGGGCSGSPSCGTGTCNYQVTNP